MHFCVGTAILAGCCQATGSKSFSHCSGSSQQRMRGKEEGKRDKDAEILEEDSLRLWLAYCAYLPYFSVPKPTLNIAQ